jgi:DinB superfamily
LTSPERTQLTRLLQESQAEFLDLIAGLTEAQWSYRPAGGGWSVGETAEHLVLAEGVLCAKMQEALASPPNPQWQAETAHKTEFLERVLPVAQQKAQAPDPLRPRMQWTREETVARFQAARTRTLHFVEHLDQPLESHTAEHPFPVFRTLNAYQWLLYIPLHNLRHDRQIAAIRSSSDFPAA